MSEVMFRALHIGGRQNDVGPLSILTGTLLHDMIIDVCEADPGVPKAGMELRKDVGKTLPYCISNWVGKGLFYLNKQPDSSSMFESNPGAWHFSSEGKTWGEKSTPDKLIDVNVTTIDKLLEDNEIEYPDMLSLDAQGSEYPILECATKLLSGKLIGVVTEVEFVELYKGQKLFCDIDPYIRKHNFCLQDFYSITHMLPDKDIGMGMGTIVAADALYLREIEYFENDPQSLSKLMIISLCYGRASYAYRVLKLLRTHHASNWTKLQAEHTCYENGARFLDKGVRNV